MVGEEPEAAFDALVDGLRTRTPGSSRTVAAAVCAIFDQLLKLVGKPDVEEAAPGSLDATLRETEKRLVAEVEKSLATMAVSFIEQPQYRLAGAEEALAQICERLQRHDRRPGADPPRPGPGGPRSCTCGCST